MKDVATLFKALSDEARVRMLWLLLNRRELCVCDFMEVLEITQSKASRHLRYLLHAGLVTDRREGLWAYYSLKPDSGELVRGLLATMRRMLSGRRDAKELLRKLDGWLEKKAPNVRCR